VRDLICWTLDEFEVCCEPISQQPMTNRGIYTAGSSFRILDVREDFLSNSEDAVPHHRERERGYNALKMYRPMENAVRGSREHQRRFPAGLKTEPNCRASWGFPVGVKFQSATFNLGSQGRPKRPMQDGS
jgi:hypothetical protein